MITTNTPLEKMLTPVEEHEDHDPFSDDDDDDDDDELGGDTTIICSTSSKIDGGGVALGGSDSRPTSGMSNPGVTWIVDSETSSLKDSVSILSGGEGQGGKVSILGEEGVGVAVGGAESRKGGSESSEESAHAFSMGTVRALLDHVSSPSSSTSPPLAPASAAEDTPPGGRSGPHDITTHQQQQQQQRSRHDVFTDSTSSSSSHRPLVKRNSHTTGSQSSSPLGSTTSHAPLSSQSSYSEPGAGGGEDGSEANKPRKYSVSDKYAKYEAYRRSIAMEARQTEVETEEDFASGELTNFSQNSTQDSSATLTEELVERMTSGAAATAEDESTAEGSGHHASFVIAAATESRDGESESSLTDGSGGRDSERGREKEGGVAGEGKELLERRLLQEIRDPLKHCDSGIDDTPDSNRSFKDGVRRLSMPPPTTTTTSFTTSSDDTHLTHLSDAKPLSYTSAFTSRESGLADSPDPELLSDELSSLHRAAAAQQRVGGASSATPQVGGTTDARQPGGLSPTKREEPPGSLVERGKVMADLAAQSSGEVEIFVPLCDEEEECLEATETIDEGERGGGGGGEREGGVRPRTRSDRLSSSYSQDRPPRSLENPSFSRYARTPIREKALSEGQVSQEDRLYRSLSMGKISVDQEEGVEGEGERVREREERGMSEGRGYTMSSSRSTLSISSGYSPIHRAQHPNQRFGVNRMTTPPSTPTSPPQPHYHHPHHHHTPNLHDDATGSTTTPPLSPDTCLRAERQRRSKGIKERLKPALRVLKINSSPSLLRAPPPPPQDEQQPRPPSSTSSFSDEGGSPKEIMPPHHHQGGHNTAPLGRRVRMMSPEAVASHLGDSSSSHTLRRSQSSEDILESSSMASGGAKGTGGLHHDPVTSPPATTKIGSLVVVPEPKRKHRGKFLEKLKGRRGGGGGGRGGGSSRASREEYPPPPALLHKGLHSVSTDGIFPLPSSTDQETRSPKNKKRHRTPHFV